MALQRGATVTEVVSGRVGPRSSGRQPSIPNTRGVDACGPQLRERLLLLTVGLKAGAPSGREEAAQPRNQKKGETPGMQFRGGVWGGYTLGEDGCWGEGSFVYRPREAVSVFLCHQQYGIPSGRVL